MANSNLTNAKRAKNDEFYTQYVDIQKEIEAYLEYEKMLSGTTFLEDGDTCRPVCSVHMGV